MRKEVKLLSVAGAAGSHARAAFLRALQPTQPRTFLPVIVV